jgi:hypothetical protein
MRGPSNLEFTAGDPEVTGGPGLDGIVSTYALTSCQTGLYIFRPTTANGSSWSAHQKIWDSLPGRPAGGGTLVKPLQAR